MKLKMLRCLRPSKRTLSSSDILTDQNKEQQFEEIRKGFKEIVNILLLGTAESGKTTIIKQMRILHINGYSDDERRDLIPEIYQNIHESIHMLVQQMRILGIEYQNYSSAKSANYILTLGDMVPQDINEEYCDHILTLWNDVGTRSCFERSNEFPLIDSAKYFLDNLERISQRGYIPSTEDILHSRRITTGIHKISFSVKIPKSLGGGEQEFRMYDVGGQRDQRNKWIQVFDGIQAVLFLISCGDFDQCLREDPKQNRLNEALSLFRGVWRNRFLASAGLIVFLNKQDIMERKIRAGKHIVDYFPEFEEFQRNQLLDCKDNFFDESDWTKKFIKQKLIEITQETGSPGSRYNMNISSHPRQCYYHFTVATDTGCIRKVFNDVHRMILQNYTSMFELV